MLVRHYERPETELIKWLLLLIAASILLLFQVSALNGSDRDRDKSRPSLMPPAAVETAKPMEAFIESYGGSAPTPRPDGMFETNYDITQAIEALRTNDEPERALQLWAEVRLPCDAEVYRYVALAVTHMRMADLPAAEQALNTALWYEPDNAVAHYYTGFLRLMQADETMESTANVCWSDAWISESLKHSAVEHLKIAVERASLIRFEAPLVEDSWVVPIPYETTMPMVSATVFDLLTALRAEAFDANASDIVGRIYLLDGELADAEDWMDRASDLGVQVLGYRKLSDAYSHRGLHLDAMRAELKSLKNGEGPVTPVVRAFEDLVNAIIDR